jgi:hypothetical protein
MEKLVKAYQKSKAQKEWMLAQANQSNLNKNSIKETEKWSINQLIFHLNNVEKSVLDYINYKNGKGELTQKAGLKAALRYYFLKVLLSTNMKFKTPKKVSQIPETLDFEQLMNDWNSTQDAFEKFLQHYPAELKGKAVFKHPYAGMLSIEQTIEFLVDHSKHHRKQMKRLI